MVYTTSIVHGNAVIPQMETRDENPFLEIQNRPGTDVIGLAAGWGREFRGRAGSSAWFHVSIPVPVSYASGGIVYRLNRVQITAFEIHFITQRGAKMDKIHVWNGSRFLEEHRLAGNTEGGINLSESLAPGMTNFNITTPPKYCSWGLGLSIHVIFTEDSSVTFSSAGAEFLIP